MARAPKDNVDVSTLTPQEKRVRTIRARRVRSMRAGPSTSGKTGGAASTGTRVKSRRTGSRYNAKGRHVDGHWFDSNAEADRYEQLAAMQAAGRIEDLELQPDFPVLINNKKICSYRGDFRYTVLDDLGRATNRVVEDVKGALTATYRLKKKMVEAYYGITIHEIPVGGKAGVPKDNITKNWADRLPVEG